MRSENLQGALFMAMAMAAFTLNDVFMKLAGATIPLAQVVFLRGIITTLGLVVLCQIFRAWPRGLARREWALIVGRALSESFAAYFFLTALFNMPIASATAILQLLPLVLTLVGALFLRETVGWAQWGAICLGFAGVLLIIQPGGASFSVYGLYALIAVIGMTLRDVFTRQLAPDTPSLFVTLVSSAVIGGLFGIGSLAVTWTPIAGPAAWYLFGAAAVVLFAYLFAVIAVRLGEIAFVTPFRYVEVPVALLAGLLVFGERLNSLALIGVLVVVLAGLYSFARERATSRS
ncbi:MAG: DMT family transporter [Pseudomonadota bacterium]